MRRPKFFRRLMVLTIALNVGLLVASVASVVYAQTSGAGAGVPIAPSNQMGGGLMLILNQVSTITGPASMVLNLILIVGGYHAYKKLDTDARDRVDFVVKQTKERISDRQVLIESLQRESRLQVEKAQALTDLAEQETALIEAKMKVCELKNQDLFKRVREAEEINAELRSENRSLISSLNRLGYNHQGGL